MSEEKEAASALLPQKTVITGASGRMGKMLLEKAKIAGVNACGISRPYTAEKLAEACKGADLIILSAPARNLEEMVCQFVPYLESNAILSDITSVKEAPMRQMEAHWQGPVVGAHPLFGPKNAPDARLPVALTPGKNATKADTGLVEAFYKALGCDVFITTAEKHDQAVARIQNMNFITNLAYFAVIAGQKDLLPFLTPSFERRKKAAEKMLTEDAGMFAGLFEANPHSHEAVRQYRRMLNLAASGDIDLLCQRARWWWQPEQAEIEEKA